MHTSISSIVYPFNCSDELENPIIDYLESDQNDTWYEARFKNALEGAGIGGTLETTFRTFRYIKNTNKNRNKENLIFYDRGIHEITAYLKSINKSTNYWDRLPENYKYDLIFIFQPWEEIYKKDENRIEEFSEAKKISPFIYKVYDNAGIKIIEVPNLSIQERVKFILNSL
mgnify:CR=1 FL=1